MKTILVPTDFGGLSAAALRFAARIGRPAGAELLLVYADTFLPPVELAAIDDGRLAEPLSESRRTAERELSSWGAKQLPEDVRRAAIVREGLPATSILATEEERTVDLVVIGTHGRGGLRRIFLGSVTEGVLRQTERPVITLRGAADDREIRKVLVGTRPDVPFLPLLREASRIAEVVGAELTALVIAREEDSGDARARVEGLLPPTARLQSVIRCGDPVHQLLDAAARERADLLVVGRERKQVVTRHAPCAVLSVVER